MKLLIIRHGDPDYTIDSLTPTGWIEAELLAQRISKLDIKAFYISPMGRARDTAAATLKKMGRQAQILPWMQEFGPEIVKPGESELSCLWDWLPKDWTAEARFYDPQRWLEVPIIAQSGAPEAYKWVTNGLDALLADHGYVRQDKFYRAVKPNEDTIVLLCHFGLECVLLSHLLGISPMVLWHGFCAAPTSVTSVITEERRQGIASFRASMFGDVSHLYAAGQAPSFSARFCETFSNTAQRHD